MSDVIDQFDARVSYRGPDESEIGPFLIQRSANASRAAFEDIISALLITEDSLLLSTPTVAVVVTTFGAAMAARDRDEIAHVGGVRIDPERLAAHANQPT